MSKDSGSKTQVVQQQANIPSWLTNIYSGNISAAQNIAKQPYTANPYAAGPGANGNLSKSWGMVGNQAGEFMDELGSGTNMISKAGQQTWSAINPQTYLNGLSNIQSYMNPYTSLVENAALANMQNALGQNINQIGANASGVGAFGGSRQGVMEGVAASEGARQYGDLSAQLRNQNWMQATQMLGQDISNDLNAQAQNQSSKIDYQKALTAAGLGMGQMAQTGYQMRASDANALNSAGMQQYGIDAAQNAGRSAEFMRQQDWNLRGLQARLAATPGTAGIVGSTQTTSGGGSSNPLLGGIGGAMAGASLGQTLAGSGLFSTGTGVGGGALLGGLLGIFSDRNEKTDIKKVGKVNGLNMYAYRYKGDPKSYPKVVGPMAQEVEKKAPGSTRKVGGRMVINGLAGGFA